MKSSDSEYIWIENTYVFGSFFIALISFHGVYTM